MSVAGPVSSDGLYESSPGSYRSRETLADAIWAYMGIIKAVMGPAKDKQYF